MTRRSTSLTSLSFFFGALLACDAAPESTPADDAPAEQNEPPTAEEPAPAPEEEAAEEPDEVDCEPAPTVPPRVMFVLDKSNSMTGGGSESGATDDGSPTRWAQLHALVGEIVAGLEAEAQTGAVLFPSSYAETSDALCDVRSVPEAALGPYRAAELLKRLPPAHAQGFRGGSPAQAAYATALDHLESTGASGPTAIVLITDGGLNCASEESPLGAPDREFAELVAFARDSLQIQTFVIGVGVAPGEQKVPFVDPDAALREIALAGGAAYGERGYFTIVDAQPLATALSTLVDRADAGTPACE